jgi:hypothetical protein
LIVIVSVGLVAVGSAAGNSTPLSKAAYAKQLTAIGKNASSSIGSLTAMNSASSAYVALGKVQVALEIAANRLSSIKPPAKIATAHAKLTAAVGELAVELSPIRAKLKTGNLQALGSVLSLKGMKDLLAANAALAKAGYHIAFGLAG